VSDHCLEAKTMEQEFPKPVRLPGQPEPPRAPSEPLDREPSEAVGDDDLFGAEAAARSLVEKIALLRPPERHAADHPGMLRPAFTLDHDRVEGPADAPRTLVVFGAFGAPSSRALGRLLAHVREHHAAGVRLAWRHYPDPTAHPRAATLALAAEAAAADGRFWALARELLELRHDDPRDLHGAMVRAGLDPERAIAAMRAGVGADRIVADVASAQDSGVMFAPTLFLDGECYRGELEAAALSDALSR
jgi:2-hydroxychromene-2-carboxylate isomerase